MSWRVVCAEGCPPVSFGEREVADWYAHQHEVGHWVQDSCAAQGVPLKVTNPNVLRQVADLLGTHSRRNA